MVVTGLVIALALGSVGTSLFLLATGGKKPKAAASVTPTPSVSATPGTSCTYVPKADENTGKKGVQPPPPFTIKENKKYTATVKTSMGTFTMKLFDDEAPCTVNSFVYLAKKRFYDGLTFHRIVKDFVIQGGDPGGDGSGGPGYTFNDELGNSLKYEIGTVAMANSGANTNGSQWFVVTGQQGVQLPKSYTIFGKVTKGLDVVMEIGNAPTVGGSGQDAQMPKEPITIEKVTVKTS
jgi:cyclophilin family peptidyl-prolyl cis-trans isomerase